MKKFHSIVMLNLIILMNSGLTARADAGDRILNCSIGSNGSQGHARLRLLHVEGHPEVQVFDLKMTIKPVKNHSPEPAVELEGLLTVEVSEYKTVLASGLMMSNEEIHFVANSVPVTLHGRVDDEQSYFLSLYDLNGDFQRGSGTPFICH